MRFSHGKNAHEKSSFPMGKRKNPKVTEPRGDLRHLPPSLLLEFCGRLSGLFWGLLGCLWVPFGVFLKWGLLAVVTFHRGVIRHVQHFVQKKQLGGSAEAWQAVSSAQTPIVHNKNQTTVTDVLRGLGTKTNPSLSTSSEALQSVRLRCRPKLLFSLFVQGTFLPPKVCTL